MQQQQQLLPVGAQPPPPQSELSKIARNVAILGGIELLLGVLSLFTFLYGVIQYAENPNFINNVVIGGIWVLPALFMIISGALCVFWASKNEEALRAHLQFQARQKCCCGNSCCGSLAHAFGLSVAAAVFVYVALVYAGWQEAASFLRAGPSGGQSLSLAFATVSSLQTWACLLVAVGVASRLNELKWLAGDPNGHREASRHSVYQVAICYIAFGILSILSVGGLLVGVLALVAACIGLKVASPGANGSGAPQLLTHAAQRSGLSTFTDLSMAILILAGLFVYGAEYVLEFTLFDADGSNNAFGFAVSVMVNVFVGALIPCAIVGMQSASHLKYATAVSADGVVIITPPPAASFARTFEATRRISIALIVFGVLSLFTLYGTIPGIFAMATGILGSSTSGTRNLLGFHTVITRTHLQDPGRSCCNFRPHFFGMCITTAVFSVAALTTSGTFMVQTALPDIAVLGATATGMVTGKGKARGSEHPLSYARSCHE